MKTKILLSTILFLANLILNAQIWEALGPDDFEQLSFNRSVETSISINSQDIPYVAFRDIDWGGGRVTVKKFNGNLWLTVGDERFSSVNARYLSFDLDNSDTPYVVYGDAAQSFKATVKKFDDTNWVTVGSDGFSDGDTNYTSIAFNSSNTPYVVYQDGNNNNNRAVVNKFEGNNWVMVGDSPASGGPALFTVISFSSSDSLFVAFQDFPNGRKATVKKLKGNTWELVGDAFSTGEAEDLSLAFNSSDTLYVSYHDKFDRKPVVKKFNGTNWITVGSSFYEEKTFQSTSPYITFDNSDTLYVTYVDGGNNNRTTVKKFDGTDWLSVGLNDISDDGTQSPHLSFSSDNTPYIVHDDTGRKAEVKKFDGSVWKTVGVEGFSESNPRHISIDIDNNNSTYVVYHRDGDKEDNKAVVKKFDSNQWVTVGSDGFSEGAVSFTSIAIDNVDTPYVAYRDDAFGNKATVKKFDGNQWVTVGTEGFSDGNIRFTSIAMDNEDVPFIAYRDGANANKATVKKFDGNQWVTVGSDGFSDNSVSYLTLDFDSSNTAYLSFTNFDSYYNYKEVKVKKFDGSNWIDLSTNDFSNDETEFAVLAIDKQDTPYVTYKDKTDGKSRVKKFNGTDWILVGSEGFSQSNFLTSITFDGANTPYAAFSDNDFEAKATVKKFNGSNWVTVETEGVSAGDIQTRPHLVFDKNGNLIMVYDSPDLFAKKYETGVLSVPLITEKNKSNILVYPNPVNDTFNIISKTSDINNIDIYDYSGRLVKSILWNKESTNLNDLAPGMYIFQIKTDQGAIISRKMLKK